MERKVRVKANGKVIPYCQNANGDYVDVSSGKIYQEDDLDFKCPHTKYSEAGDIICGDYTEERAFGYSPAPKKNFRVDFDSTEAEKDSPEIHKIIVKINFV